MATKTSRRKGTSARSNAAVFKQAVEGLHLPTVLLDADMAITYINRAMKQLLSNLEAEFKTTNPSFDVDALEGVRFDSLHQQLSSLGAKMTGGEDFHTEVTIDARVYQLDVACVDDAKGQPCGYSVEWTDVTDKRDLSGQFEAVDRVQARIEFTPDGTILNANENFCAAVGYSLEEIKGQHHRLFVEPEYANSPEYAQFWTKLGQGEKEVGEFFRFGKNQKGIWINASYNPVFDSDGNVIKVVKFATDITEQKELAQEKRWPNESHQSCPSDHRIRSGWNDSGTPMTIFARQLGIPWMKSKVSTTECLRHLSSRRRKSTRPFGRSWDQANLILASTSELEKTEKRSGSTRRTNPIFDARGNVVKVVKFATDITEQKHQSLNFSGQLDAINRVQAVIEFTLDGIILDANENFIATVGYTLDEIRGQHHKMFVEPELASSAEYRAFWERLGQGQHESGEFFRLGKNGKEIWLNASYNPIFDANGNVVKVIKFATDITEQKESALESDGQLKAINRAQAVIEFTPDGTILTANENFTSTVGYSLDEIVGKHHRIFVDPEYASTPDYRQFWEKLGNGELDAGEYKRFGRDGNQVWLNASYNPIFDAKGRVVKVVKFASDITEQKEMAAQIAEAQQRDARLAEEMQEKVNEILDVANRVGNGDYSVELTVFGEDAIGQLGEGLAQFFNDKRAKEEQEQRRAEVERQRAAELQDKVEKILTAVNSLAEGDFTIDVPELGSDEVGQVASALSSAVTSMRSALVGVREVAGGVSSSAQELTSATQEVSRGAQNQASSLEETASSLEEITTTVKQNTDNAQQARQLANGSRDVAENGGQVVGEAVKAMAEINQASTKIANIITTIDEIAFQTNLLALNAAVEAARAGEQGRGFAVVAAEVRNLAQRSASAAKEIKALIQDSVRKVENGTELVNESGKTLSEIVNSVKRVTDIVAEIAAASKEQLAGIEQVNRAMSSMDRVTQNNATQTEQMSSTASNLAANAGELQQMVGHFKLDDGAPTFSAPHSHVEDDFAGQPVAPPVATPGPEAPGILEF